MIQVSPDNIPSSPSKLIQYLSESNLFQAKTKMQLETYLNYETKQSIVQPNLSRNLHKKNIQYW